MPYLADGVTTVRVVPGYVTTVVLGADERIVSVAVGNSAAWEVTPNKTGDRLFIKSLGTGASTNVEVVTDSRQYSLLLQTAYEGDPEAAFRVVFDYPTAAVPPAASPSATAALPVAPAVEPTRYRIDGDPSVRPLAVTDDGSSTRFAFDPAVALPAVYALDAQGRETLVTTRQVDGALVVDHIWPGYVLRRGGRRAEVHRVVRRSAR